MAAKAESIPARDALLQRLLLGRARPLPPAIRVRDPLSTVPLSVEQEHLWAHMSLSAETRLYNEAITIRRSGPCDRFRLAASLNAVIRRHAAWRTDFQSIGGHIVARVHDSLELPLAFTDLSQQPGAEAERAAQRLATADASLPFDLAQAPLLRGRIVKFGEHDHRLYLSLHHIIFDGVSLYQAFMPTLTRVYASLAAHGAEQHAPAIDYPDYAVWQHAQRNPASIDKRLGYWRDKLLGAPPFLRLPIGQPRQPDPSSPGGMEVFALSTRLSNSVRRASLALGVTQFAWLLTVFQTLLFRYSGQTDLVVGGVADTRKRSELDAVMGYFLNTLPIRTHPAAGLAFAAYARQTNADVLAMMDASDIALSDIVRDLQPPRQAGVHPLFQVVFSVQPPATPCDGWDLTQMDVCTGTAKFDLYLEFEERAQGLAGRILYRSDLFEAATISRMIDHLITLIQDAAANPGRALAQLHMLSAHELDDLRGWNATHHHNADGGLLSMFRRHAACTPHAPAVRTPQETLTYEALDALACGVAGALRQAGVSPGDLVAICVERSACLPAILLGVLAAGAAYMPLDPRQPAARLAECIAQTDPILAITEPHLAPLLNLPDAQMLMQETIRRWTGATDLQHADDEQGLAYVICTSGTTGQPKAVEIPRTALMNLLLDMGRRLNFRASDSLLAITTLSFDIAALEIFMPLLHGGSVLLASRDLAEDPSQLVGTIASERPSFMQATPSAWRALVDAGLPAQAMTILVGGEALPRTLADALLACTPQVWNVYGPTETTIWSTAHRVQQSPSPAPIGHPIANTTAFVVDAVGVELPVGVHGELCIGGLGLARGYRGNAALSAERFTWLQATAGERVYRTGDIVYRTGDGALVWVGRNDDQCKIRGARVEPGEVEALLSALPGVSQAAVVVGQDATGAPALVAHLVAQGANASALRRAAGALLPAYMVPTLFVFHDALPLSTSGKVDRRHLPRRPQQVSQENRPETETEQDLAVIWRRVLGCEELDMEADFFASGGHSLLAVALLSEVAVKFACRIGPASFFQAPSVRSLAAEIERQRAAAVMGRVKLNPAAAGSAAGARFGLKLVRRAAGTSRGSVLVMPGERGFPTGVAAISKHALPNFDVWAFFAREDGGKMTDGDAWLACARSIADRLAGDDDFRPAAFIGYCFGGYLGWLVDRLLVSRGGKPTPIINFDGGAPHLNWAERQAALRRILPALGSLEPERMLLLSRKFPAKFRFLPASQVQWRRAGVRLTELSFSTLGHPDVILPASVAACATALSSFAENQCLEDGFTLHKAHLQTSGGALFRLLAADAPPSAADITSFLQKMPLPNDDTERMALLFLVVATCPPSFALDTLRRMEAARPGKRALTYAQTALLRKPGQPMTLPYSSAARLAWHEMRAVHLGSDDATNLALAMNTS